MQVTSVSDDSESVPLHSSSNPYIKLIYSNLNLKKSIKWNLRLS